MKQQYMFSSYTTDTWQDRWEEFKENLPHQRKPFSKRNWGDSLHSLCSYQGKMKPALAYHLIQAFMPKKGKTLDPFVGVGTIPFEAIQNHHIAYGFDINPAALAISRGKTGKYSIDEYNKMCEELKLYINNHQPNEEEYLSAEAVKFNGAVPEYFHPETLREILLTRRFFLNNPPSTGTGNLVFSAILHILHGNRPYALSRRSHPITPYKPSGEYIYKSLIEKLEEKISRSVKIWNRENAAHIYSQDATEPWNNDLPLFDTIITSPPFYDSTRFHIGNWMRLWFAGWEREDFKTEPARYIDERQKKSFEVYRPIFKQSRNHLKDDGVMVLHLGLSKKADMAHEVSAIAQNHFDIYDIFVEDVGHTEKHGIRDKGTVKGHQYLVLTPK